MAEYPELYDVTRQDTFDQWRTKHNLLIDAFNTLDENAGDTTQLPTASKNIVGAANELWNFADTNAKNIGNVDTLNTTVKTNVVDAINNLKEEKEKLIGDVTNLVTDDARNIVSAINSIDLAVGNRSDLQSEVKTTIVDAINRLTYRIGDLSQLNVDSNQKENIVDAVNNIVDKIGGSDMSQLKTTTKTTLINSINELVQRLDTLQQRIADNEEDIGNISTLNTVDRSTIVNAINELKSNIGGLSSLNTSTKNSIVAAINELNSNIGNKNLLTTDTNATIVDAINEINTWKKNSSGDVYYTGKVAVGKTIATSELDVNGTIKANKFIGDIEGNVIGNVTGNVTGNVSGTSSRWANPMTLKLTGEVDGEVAFDGSSAVTMTTSFPNGPYAAKSHNHDDRYVKLEDKNSGVYLNLRGTGSTNDATTARNWAFAIYPDNTFSGGDYLFIDRKYQWTTRGYNRWYTHTQYWRDIWLKYDNSNWMLLSSSRV